jgi:protease-4
MYFHLPKRLTRTLMTFSLLALAVPALAQQTVLRVWLHGEIMESPREDAEIVALLGETPPKPFHTWIKMIQEAAASKDIDGIALIIDNPMIGIAQSEEMIRALKAFRATGKTVHAYLDYAGNISYMLATAADEITITEHSSLDIMGLHAAMGYYKNMLDKIGVRMQMIHIGDYKSAGEPYTRTGPSEAAAEQTNWLLDGIYDRFVQVIADGRGLTRDQVTDAIDQAPLNVQKAKKLGLVDRISSFSDFRNDIEAAFGSDVRVVKSLDEAEEVELDFENPFAIFSKIGEMMEESTAPRDPGVGVIYIEGPIIAGKSQNLFGSISAAAPPSERPCWKPSKMTTSERSWCV